MVTNAFEISYESLRISYEAYDQSAEFRVNPLRMLRLLTNVLSPAYILTISTVDS